MKFAPWSIFALVAMGAFLSTRADVPSSANTAQTAGVVAKSPQSDPQPTDLRAQLETAQKQIRELEAEVARLRVELDAQTKARLARESEFLRYTQGIAQLSSLAGSPIPRFQTDALAEAQQAAAKHAEDERRAAEAKATASATSTQGVDAKDATRADANSANSTSANSTSADSTKVATDKNTAEPRDSSAKGTTATTDPSANAAKSAEPSHEPLAPELSPARSAAVHQALRSLFALEQVTGFDLLESGALRPGFMGPVVLRVLDDRGRPLGVLAADRLRLEASRSARMVTVVLENGCERRAGVKTPFEGGPVDADGRGGVRRIALPDCDPKPWIEAVPELFRNEDRDTSIDDGRVNLVQLRAAINQLLRVDAVNGWYRVQGIGGVQVNVLRDVAIDQLDRDGKIEKRLFADRMSILREAQGLQISLVGGSQVRGDQKSAFLDGRYRIFLPRADGAAWAKAGIPVSDAAPVAPALNPAPESAAPKESPKESPNEQKLGPKLDARTEPAPHSASATGPKRL